ncbi:MAG TPA: hypothetical protein VGV38_22030 [Pyrinomonadaceae bacterium]|nr:hypothetical protein [Pyrinomonadaceae bacterium]
MIFTDRFVYVHEPKTGGTFVTSALFRLYGLKWTRRTHLRNALLRGARARHPKYGALVHDSNKHGFCRHIPEAHRSKPVLATVRNPFDLYVSQYEFGWWKRREFLPLYRAVTGFERAYPRFPELTFAEYVRLANDAFPTYANGGGPRGLLTEQFLKYYFRDPERAFARLGDKDYISSGRYRADMFDLHFVRTDQLNRGLYDFLLRFGYEDEDVRFVVEMERVLPRGKGRSAAQRWEHYYTPELKREVRERERFLFSLFPEFDTGEV